MLFYKKPLLLLHVSSIVTSLVAVSCFLALVHYLVTLFPVRLLARRQRARAFVVTDNFRQIVDVRLNGVNAQCTAEANGDVLVAVKLVKTDSDLSENAEPDIAVVPMLTAILDADDQVLSNDSFGYKNGFDIDLRRLCRL